MCIFLGMQSVLVPVFLLKQAIEYGDIIEDQ